MGLRGRPDFSSFRNGSRLPDKIHISDFKGGWNPSVDAFNAPGDCLVRADNLVWDQTNVPRLREGSIKITNDLGNSVNKSYTTILDGVRRRLRAVGDTIFENNTLLGIAAGNADLDAAFGSHMDQILMTRYGPTRLKWDGTTVRNWGIAAPTATPTVTQAAGNTTVISTCNNGTWATALEGSRSDVVGYDGGQAQKIAPNTTTYRGVLSTVFAVKNLNDYSGEAGCDDDLVECYLLVESSELLESLSLQLDANGASAAPFQDDYYQVILNLSTAVKVKLSGEEAVNQQSVEGYERDRVVAEFRNNIQGADWDGGTGSTSRVGRAASWVRISVPRGKFERVGSTNGKGWATIVGARIIIQYTGTGGGGVSIDNLTISGGVNHALTGSYQIRYVYVYDSGKYEGKSAYSAASTPVDIRAGAARVTVPASPDTQVNETWVYIMGGGLNRFYRAGIMNSNGGTQNFGLSEVTVAILNVTIENNSAPPDNIIGIVGPHASRTWVLTPTQLCPSRRNNPDSFDLTQAIVVGDDTEVPYWVVLTSEGNLFVGTSKTIYAISGYGLEYPDGTTDFQKRSIKIEPPIDYGVETDGFGIFYMASDGWRGYAGGVSKRIVGNLDLLYRNQSRYGVSAVNLGSGHARFRCAFYAGKLYALSGEGVAGNDEYSAALHVFDMKTGLVERRLYPFNIVSLYREPDGKVLAGCTDGYVRELEIGSQDDDVAIPYTIWTPLYHGGTPLHYKDPFDMSIHMDTGGYTLTAAMHLDSSETANFTTTFATSNEQVMTRRTDSMTSFRCVQARLTGSSSSLVLRELVFNYRSRPQSRLFVDTGYFDTGRNFSTWVRRVVIKARTRSRMTVVAYFDDTAFGPYQAAATPLNKVTQFNIPMPKNYKGRQARIVVYVTDNAPVPPGTSERVRIDEFSRLATNTASLSAIERMRFATVGFGLNPINPETDNSFEIYKIGVMYATSGNENEAVTQWVPIG